jgi:hypothetical protein
MNRLNNGRYLKERQLGPYMEHYHSQRLSPTLDDFHSIEYKDKLYEPIPRLPFFDKVEHNQWEMNLQKIVEITTPIGSEGDEEVEMEGSTSR